MFWLTTSALTSENELYLIAFSQYGIPQYGPITNSGMAQWRKRMSYEVIRTNVRNVLMLFNMLHPRFQRPNLSLSPLYVLLSVDKNVFR